METLLLDPIISLKKIFLLTLFEVENEKKTKARLKTRMLNFSKIVLFCLENVCMNLFIAEIMMRTTLKFIVRYVYYGCAIFFDSCIVFIAFSLSVFIVLN